MISVVISACLVGLCDWLVPVICCVRLLIGCGWWWFGVFVGGYCVCCGFVDFLVSCFC